MEKTPNSWWADWVARPKPQCGKLTMPTGLGGEKYPPLLPAPGNYALEQ